MPKTDTLSAIRFVITIIVMAFILFALFAPNSVREKVGMMPMQSSTRITLF